MRGIGVTKQIAGQPSDLATYLARVSQMLFSPHFSPDGRYIAYGQGEPGFAMAANDFYVWDLAAKKVHLINRNLQTPYIDLPWSPDSTHLAFAINIDDPADTTRTIVRLYAHDAVKHENHVVVDNLLMDNPLGLQYQSAIPFAWTPQGNLLVTKQPEPAPAKDTTAEDAPKPPPLTHPNIYAIPPDGGKATLLISEAFDPLPSPDSQWIVYSGWYNTEVEDKEVENKEKPDAKKLVERPGIFLFHKAQKKRILARPLPLSQGRGQIPTVVRVRWTPDSQRLVLIEMARTPGPVDKSLSEAHISTLNVPPTLEAENADPKAVPMVSQAAIQSIAKLQAKEGYDVQEISRDGRFLFIYVAEGFELAAGQSSEVVSQQAVNLKDGTVSLVARFYNNGGGRISGWGWYDQSTPVETVKTSAAKIP